MEVPGVRFRSWASTVPSNYPVTWGQKDGAAKAMRLIWEARATGTATLCRRLFTRIKAWFGHCYPLMYNGYLQQCLSYRDVEELLFARGVMVSYEAIRKWCRKFGQRYANGLRHRRPKPGDKWHLDEVFLTIRGTRHYLWRAVDQEGNILDILVQCRRDKHAAKTFFRKLLKGCQYIPRVIVTDKLASYGAAKHELLPSVEHRQHRYLNNRAENSHQPTRQRERIMRRFKSSGHAQRFLAAYGPIASHFRPRRHRLRARYYREAMIQRFQSWREITGTPIAA